MEESPWSHESRTPRKALPSRGELALMDLLLRKPLLTQGQIALLLEEPSEPIGHCLDSLARGGYIDTISPSTAQPAYHLTPRGLRLALRRSREQGRPLALDYPAARKRTESLVRCLAHTLGCNRFFLGLLEQGRRRALWGEEGLLEWQGEMEAVRRYRYFNFYSTLRADGFGRYRLKGRELSFYLEWDNASRGQERYWRKFENWYRYYEILREGGWDSPLPSILVVTTSNSRERSIAWVVHRLAGLMQCPLLPLLITTQKALDKKGPLAPIWWSLALARRCDLVEGGLWTGAGRPAAQAAGLGTLGREGAL